MITKWVIQKIVFHHAFQLISENARHSGEKSMDKVNQPTLHFEPATLATREKGLADLARSLVGERIRIYATAAIIAVSVGVTTYKSIPGPTSVLLAASLSVAFFAGSARCGQLLPV